MNSGVFKSNASRCAFICKFSFLVLLIALFPHQAKAATADTQFKQFLWGLCNGVITQPQGAVWDTASLTTMCFNLGGISASGGGVSANLGTTNASSGMGLRRKKGIREVQDDQKVKPDKGASADGSGWGFLVTPQYGKSNRIDTDFENGYQSDLKGLVVGLDYRFSDSVVLGATLGNTKDDATFLNSAGSLKTSNDTLNLYGTWILSEDTSVDGYLGYGRLNFESQRHVAVVVGLGGILGTTSGSTNGQQIMAGISTSYQKDLGRMNLSPFINLDYIKTRINGYSESGTTTLEMHYSDRSTISFTSSLGVRASTSYGRDWGTLQPSVRLAAVHEFQNNAKRINNELVSTPGTGFMVSTDTPDRNYLNLGLGVSAALNGGTQLFLDYDKRAQDRLLSSWAISLGALMEF